MTLSIPDRHDAICISAPGGPDVLKRVARDVPRCSDDELLIAVDAAGINRHDVNQRRRGPEPGVRDIPGLELAGTVVKTGSKVTGWQVGDKVCGLVDGGAYAQYAVLPAVHALPVPSGFTTLEAGALPEALFTVWHNFFNVAQMGPGETVLIHGGTSGVGTIAIQLLTALGHPVFVTCGTDEKCAVARELGAVGAYNYRRDDWVENVRTSTAAAGVDVILDMAGGRYSEQNVQALARRGRLVHLSPGQGAAFNAPLRAIMAKEAKITGSLLRPLPEHEKTAIARTLQNVVWPLLGSRIKPQIHKVFALGEAEQAHALMESASYAGKLMLDCTK